MTEDFRSGPGATGYPIDPATVDLDIYRLLLVFAASRPLHTASTGEDNDPVNLLRQQFEESEASRTLVSLAIVLRNAMDNRGKSLLESQAAEVGTLIKDLEHPGKKEPLSLRESCHKLIHARQMNFDTAGNTPGKPPYLRPKVHLYGQKYDKKEKRDVQWKATLDILSFARKAMRFMTA